MELASVIQRPDVRESFDMDLLSWLKAVINYSKDTQRRNTVLREKVSDYSDDLDPSKFISNINLNAFIFNCV